MTYSPDQPMTSKLTLRMDEDVKERAKEIARERGTSLSALVEDYFRLLSRKDSPDDAPFDEPRGNLSDDEQQFVKATTDKQA